jgi:deoxyribonuclease-4
MKIGAHISTRGNYEKMARYAKEVGCECIQIFAKSPRTWKANPMPISKRDEMRVAREVYDFGPILTHTSYLINFSTDKEELYEKSIDALADEVVRGAILEAEGVNTHVGNVPDGDVVAAGIRAARAIERVFEIADKRCEEMGIENNTRLILENTAGAGSSYGGSMTELSTAIVEANVSRERLGICIDTCHAWAYGYDVSRREGWQEIVDELIGANSLDLWLFGHANDCKFPRGSKRDRHAWIGEGEIGFDGFKALLHLGEEYPELDRISLLTEMPGEEPQKDIINIDTLKALRND